MIKDEGTAPKPHEAGQEGEGEGEFSLGVVGHTILRQARTRSRAGCLGIPVYRRRTSLSYGVSRGGEDEFLLSREIAFRRVVLDEVEEEGAEQGQDDGQGVVEEPRDQFHI